MRPMMPKVMLKPSATRRRIELKLNPLKSCERTASI
jgi:hypothetical protein